ncbi:nuclear mRNA splicing protein [Lentinula aff. detonsa]|nr:nuclear mRNA splicing protein [Lentinula aff. detonsa]
MQSLRSRRSQGPARKPTRQPTNGKLAKDARPRRRDTSGRSRVDDKIKKRMSTRYADISSPTELNVPRVPTLPIDTAGGRRTDREQDESVRDQEDLVSSQKAADAAAEEKKLLDDKTFDPDAYLKKKLANSTEAELKSLQSSLRSSKDDTASELQRSVFKNYAEFVMISKEISTLENEMLELKESLSEYKSMPSMLHIPDPTSSSSSISTYRRSSVADLRIMYFNQMQQLHAQIEGSAKFAPTTPGRHVVGEADGVLSLNAATYKVMGRVKFVVLDDAVLVAKRRRRTAGGGGDTSRRAASRSEGKLVAERSWSLNEMVVLDSKDSSSMTNVFKVRHGKETHVFRTETLAEKKTLLGMLRQVGDEYNAKKRKEREGEHERRKSMFPGADQSSSSVPPDWMAEFAKLSGGSSATSGTDAKEKSERDIRWTGEWADELTVSIALRQWSRAVESVEEGRKKLSTIPPLAAKLPVLTTQLITAILEDLSHTSNRKSTVVALISYLVRLNAGPGARSTFLTMRSQVMKGHVRKIRFEGHVGAYVADLAMVYFTGIKHTADWFLASFKENEVASAFIDWARLQVETYAEIFRTQVYSSGVEGKVVEEALQITYDLSKKLLEEYGLDFRFLLDEQLAENPKIQPKLVSSEISIPSLKEPLLARSSNTSAPKLAVSTSSGALNRKVPTALNIPSPYIQTGPSSSSTTPLAGSGAPISTASAYPDTGVFKGQMLGSVRSRTPVGGSGALPIPSAYMPPNSAPVTSVPASPIPRQMRTPPPSAGKDRSPRSGRGAGSPAPPPRSTNRPGSSISRTTHIAVAQRDGMI